LSLTSREEHGLIVLENRVFRKIFGTKRKEVTVGWRKMYTEEMDNLYSSPDVIRMINSRRMRWMWHMAQIEDMTTHTEFW
jgi:hypothetical protein